MHGTQYLYDNNYDDDSELFLTKKSLRVKRKVLRCYSSNLRSKATFVNMLILYYDYLKILLPAKLDSIMYISGSKYHWILVSQNLTGILQFVHWKCPIKTNSMNEYLSRCLHHALKFLNTPKRWLIELWQQKETLHYICMCTHRRECSFLFIGRDCLFFNQGILRGMTSMVIMSSLIW